MQESHLYGLSESGVTLAPKNLLCAKASVNDRCTCATYVLLLPDSV